LDIPEDLAVYNWRYSDEGDRPIQYLTFPPGEQTLNGYEAVAFGRNRSPDDTYRVRRQQLVMQAALQKVFTLNLLDDPLGLYEAYQDTVRHDVPVGKMPGLANLLRGSRGKIETYSLGEPVNGVETVYGFFTESGAAVLGYDYENVRHWLNLTFPKTAYSASTVEIQNGYGVDGRDHAEALGHYLRFAKDLPTVYLGPPQDVQPYTTIIVYDDTRAELANDIAEWMHIPPERMRWQHSDDASLPDVVIVIGEDFILPGG